MDIEYANNAMKKVLEDPRLIARKHGDIAKTLTLACLTCALLRTSAR